MLLPSAPKTRPIVLVPIVVGGEDIALADHAGYDDGIRNRNAAMPAGKSFGNTLLSCPRHAFDARA
jgi:hypothetical protein